MSTIYKRSPKILEIRVELPAAHLGQMTVKLSNPNYMTEKKIVDFCHMGIIKTGDNLPCVHMAKDIEVSNRTGTTFFTDADG